MEDRLKDVRGDVMVSADLMAGALTVETANIERPNTSPCCSLSAWKQEPFFGTRVGIIGRVPIRRTYHGHHSCDTRVYREAAGRRIGLFTAPSDILRLP
jgi:hypothetical protein